MKISIPQPCHENWNKMLPEEKGRFCLSCQKCVYDFTKMSDKEVIDILQKPNQCGRFSSVQLDRINKKLDEQSNFRFPRMLRYSTLMIALGLGGNLVAQEKEKIEVVESNNNEPNLITSDSIRIISGNIKDSDGFPMYSAKITFPNRQSTLTNENGNFKIGLSNFYDNQFQVTITDEFGQDFEKDMDISNNDFVVLSCEYAFLGEVAYYRKRTVAGKVLRTFSWPFRQIGKIF